ncbi:hypothetical protein TWF694_011617 [Orbilia ellipsospora]|uniref:Uncharacterized protein n=1 Tax=Orbilia ellipsospora TaxID=2528407 RepID=A0AAV9X5T2_9PEZI
MAKPNGLRVPNIETNWTICNFCFGFLVIAAIVGTCELWYTRVPAPILKNDAAAVDECNPTSSPAVMIQDHRSLGIHGQSMHRIEKRARGKNGNPPPKKGAGRQTVANGQRAQSAQSSAAAAVQAELARYQALLLERVAEEKRAAAEALRQKAEWNDLVLKALREQEEPYQADRPLFYAIENRLFDQPPGLLGPKDLWDAEDVFNDFDPKDRLAVFPKKYQPPKGKSLFDEHDSDDWGFLNQMKDIESENVREMWNAIEDYSDEEEAATGTMLFQPLSEVREWHEQVVQPPKVIEEQTGKIPKGIDVGDTSMNSARLGSTASQTLSTIEGDSTDRQGLDYITRIPSQSFNLGVIESVETESEEDLAHEGFNGQNVNDLEEPFLNAMKGVTKFPGQKKAPVRMEEERKVNNEMGKGSSLIDDIGFIPIPDPNEKRLGREMNANDRYAGWAKTWKGPIFPRMEKDWKDLGGQSSLIPATPPNGYVFSTEWKNAIKSEYGIDQCPKRTVEYYGKVKEAHWCQLKKSKLNVAWGLPNEIAQKLDLFLYIGCRAVTDRVNCGTRHWYLQQKKVSTSLEDGSKAYEDVYIDVRFDLASASPIDAALGHGGIGLPHAQLTYLLPSELSEYQPASARVWDYFEFPHAIKLDSNILNNMFSELKLPFHTAWPKGWVQGDFIAPETPWGPRKANGKEVPIPQPKDQTLIKMTGRQRVILTTKGWNGLVLDRSGAPKVFKA